MELSIDQKTDGPRGRVDGQFWRSGPPNKTIDNHFENYLKQRKIIEERLLNFEEFIDIQDYLARNRINCFKYNYSLEQGTQNMESYPALIELSKDFQELKFITRRPNDKVKYVLEADPEYLQEQRIKEHKKQLDLKSKKQRENIDIQMKDPDYINKVSSASTSIHDI